MTDTSPTAPAPDPVTDVERAVAQVRALEWLTRQPLDRLPVLVWFADEDGGLVGHPADLGADETRTAFEAWAAHLQFEPDPRRHRGGATRLRVQGRADGILVTVHAVYRPADCRPHRNRRPAVPAIHARL